MSGGGEIKGMLGMHSYRAKNGRNQSQRKEIVTSTVNGGNIDPLTRWFCCYCRDYWNCAVIAIIVKRLQIQLLVYTLRCYIGCLLQYTPLFLSISVSVKIINVLTVAETYDIH